MLTPEDWYLVGFYTRVADQYTNQTPMGTEKGPPVLTPRLEGYAAALRLHRYQRADWSWLVEGASYLHRVVHGQERIDRYALWQEMKLEDFLDPR